MINKDTHPCKNNTFSLIFFNLLKFYSRIQPAQRNYHYSKLYVYLLVVGIVVQPHITVETNRILMNNVEIWFHSFTRKLFYIDLQLLLLVAMMRVRLHLTYIIYWLPYLLQFMSLFQDSSYLQDLYSSSQNSKNLLWSPPRSSLWKTDP